MVYIISFIYIISIDLKFISKEDKKIIHLWDYLFIEKITVTTVITTRTRLVAKSKAVTHIGW